MMTLFRKTGRARPTFGSCDPAAWWAEGTSCPSP